MKVFISSTSEDLRPYRDAAADVIRDAQWVPVGMEHFPADPRPIVRLCREEVGQCGLVILLQAFRRGWVPEPEKGGDGKTSVTGLEIAAADELTIPVLAFLANEDWPGRLWDHDPAALAWTRDFRNGLNRSAKFFQWEQDPKLPLFRALLSQELANYRLRGLADPDGTIAPSATLRAPSAEPPLPPEPYPLLGPYEHPRTFAGRDAEVAKLTTLVRLPPLVLCVHAPSGAGKSSLLLAGLGPRLRSLGYAVSIERAPGDAGLAQRLLRDLFESPEGIVIDDADADLPAAFARWIAQAHTLSGKPAVLILDQIDDVLRSPANRDPALARIGPLLAATAQRLPALQGFACKWVLCYRHEFHGEVRGWLEDVLAQARALGLPRLRSLPHDLSDPQKSHDWVLPVMGKPAPGGDGEEQSERAFLEAITAPLALLEEGRPVYRYRLPADGAQRLAAAFARARQRQPDAPLVPELQVVLNHLLQRADDSGTAHAEAVTVEVPPDEELEAEIKHALARHLERVLSDAFPEGRDPAASRLARTRALLALHHLADAEGRRGKGLPEDELVRLLGSGGNETLDRLSSPQARLLVVADGQWSLSHDRLAEVVSELVKSEAARGNLLLDQRLIDLQRIIGQKAALFQADPTDESALALTRPQIELIERNGDTLLFDASRRSWHQGSHEHRRRLHRKRLRLMTVAALFLAGIGILVLAIGTKVVVTWEKYSTQPENWTVRGDLAISAVEDRGVTVWNLRKPFSSHITSTVPCKEYEISSMGRYIAGVTAKGDLYVWSTGGPMAFTPQSSLSGLRWNRFIKSVGFSSDDRLIFAVAPTGDVYLWNPAQAADAKTPLAHFETEPPDGAGFVPNLPWVSFSPRGSWLIVGWQDKVLGFQAATEQGKPAEPSFTLAVGFEPLFSDDDQWLLWKEQSGPLHLRNLSTSTTIDIDYSKIPTRPRWLIGMQGESFAIRALQASAPQAGAPGAVEVFLIAWFHSIGDWVAGRANDHLYLWSLRKLDLGGEPLFSESYSKEPSFAFSPDGLRAATASPDGGLYAWRLGDTIGPGQLVARAYSGVQVRFSEDGAFLYAADPKNLYFGLAESSLDITPITGSPVQAVAVLPDHRVLAVFTRDQVRLGRRRLFIWGIPLPFDLSWPALSEPLQLPFTPPR